ncbi:unnamed protein product [Didymodactylos carnosus]|uniref:Uncharacterized protein n=1 Tax=Didymodactylos carnosus TaxID=1234261 RepID=A0A814LJW5_9BILA|nr:unnamed protein product [Didymodactylos carnosus]CAF3834775.1 unnamed protein product [Didymodactylos carnosus]
MSTNNNGSPYLGSKISLVSKAKIRYEGILYTIDANESTVALAKVRSYGTEDRPTERPVPAREEIFEYIIFRGADIEDLQVCEPPQSAVTQDPAIVRSSEPTPFSTGSRLTGNSTSLPGIKQDQIIKCKILYLSLYLVSSQQNVPSSSNALQNALVTATAGTTISPTLLQSKSIDRNTTSNNSGNRQTYYNNNNTRYNNNSHQSYNNRQQMMGSGGNENYGDMNEGGYGGYDNGYNNYDVNSYGMNGGRKGYNRYQQRSSIGNQQQRPMRQQSQPQQRERANSTRERANSTRGSRSALKFTGDFDFEKANAEFDKNAITEELKKSLSIKPTSTTTNVKKDTSDSTTTTTISNSNTNDQTTKSQSPTTTSSENDDTILTKQSYPQQQDNVDQSGFYDKTKSFFDRISCEATEKDKTNARRNWAEERKMNAETFGLPYRPQTTASGYQQQQRGFQRGRGSNMYNNNNNNNRQMYYNNSMYYNNRQRPMGGNGGYDRYEMNGTGGGGGYNSYRNYAMNGGMRGGRGIRAQS